MLPGLCYYTAMAKRKKLERPTSWPDWFEPKRYPHFDQPIRDPEQVRWLVESPEAVACHAFLPFIHFQKNAWKYKREPPGFVKKPRPLSYASHTDSLIFRRYCLLLTESYEKLLANLRIEGSVLAYRRFTPPKCNIHFANDAFRFIEEHVPCVAMAFDVKDFFESLDHKRLKQQWKQVLNVAELPPDQFAVFKAVTRYAWVERESLFEILGITKKKLADWRGPICTPKQFRDLVRTENQATGLIEVRKGGKGVPQGSAISALLSNLYMVPVDMRLAELAKARGGLYFRYSDDILIVCPPSAKTELEAELRTQMDSAGLLLHDGPGKSTIATFELNAEGNLCTDRPLQYLGFSFDGQHVRVRSQTVARYMRRMRKAVRREKYLAERRLKDGGDGRVRRKHLYSRYTHLGKRNFISYTKKAQEVFLRNRIRQQLRRHWHFIHASLEVE